MPLESTQFYWPLTLQLCQHGILLCLDSQSKASSGGLSGHCLHCVEFNEISSLLKAVLDDIKIMVAMKIIGQICGVVAPLRPLLFC